MQNQLKVVDFQSDKELLRNLLNNFGSVIVFIFYSDANEKSKQFLNNFSNSVNIFGAYNHVVYYSLQAARCSETFGKFNVETTPTVIVTQTDKKILKRYQVLEDIGLIFDQLSAQIQKYRQQYESDKKFWLPKIQSLLSSCPVIIFIKGTPQNPKCGFTRTLLQILKDHKVQFTYIDIVDDQYTRYWLRAIRHWATYPQMFVNGKFIGGLDLIKESVEKGELANIIPESSKTQNPELKYNLLVKENQHIAFTNNFSFENKETESFLNKQKEKYQNLKVCNVSLDSKLSDYIKSNLKTQLPFLVSEGKIQSTQ